MPNGKDKKQNFLRRNSSVSISDARIAGLYDLEHTIGKGHFAVVKLARHVFTGEKVAVKVIDKTKLDPESAADLMQEVRCMKLVQHPNIVRLYEVIDTKTKLFLILELGDYDMYDYIMKTSEKGIKESDAQQYFSQITKAIDYCHALHVVHRDLKPENVVFFEKVGMVKLTDFGFSNLYTPGQMLTTSCGSLAYSAPEILLGDSYEAPAIDVWSLGVILYMLVCGRLPFQEANDSETLTRILDCRYTIPDHVSPNCKDLIQKMLVRDPTKRASLPDILNSPWVVAGDRGHAEALPLVFRDHLPDVAHSTIIEQMVAGGIGTEENILNSIERGEYSYLTATYYLLAERILSGYREEQAQKLRKISSSTNEDVEYNSGPVTANNAARSRSNSFRGLNNRRACTILKEESEEELSSYLRSSSRQSSRYFNLKKEGSLRRSFPSRASSAESSRTNNPTISEDLAVSYREDEKVPLNDSHLLPKDHTFEELSPIREMMENQASTNGLSCSGVVGGRQPSTDPSFNRTPSAPIPISSLAQRTKRQHKHVLSRRNSSPSVSMFAKCSIYSSRDRISPHAIQELLELSRYSSMKRAASPDRLDSPISRSSSPSSSGRTSPAVSVSGITARLKASTLASSTGMRKLSSSPHLLGICEEIEDSEEPASSFKTEAAPVFSVDGSLGKSGRDARSASTGYSGHRWQIDPHLKNHSFGELNKKSSSYASLRAIRTKQLQSPDVSRLENHYRIPGRSRRSTSCSSSDTSDDDCNERRLNLIAMKYCKRNSDETNSDDDPPASGSDWRPQLTHSKSEGRQSSDTTKANDAQGTSYMVADDMCQKRVNLHPILEHPTNNDSYTEERSADRFSEDGSSEDNFCRHLRRSCSLEGRSKKRIECPDEAPLY
ncbi:unnamed protein product [Bursaphelenchus okinawaensis]|uniref:SNF-related serine/threonine-protein kinase n=1 Tax=Bursaphelenchus okinawaensis TaxID=465554 RepID=A0A811JUG4_9BILA|nr:unnamed protein product [Bursaphelenchus okinawaensis]CAG9082984.1 unnamed protein product [Bursaphelenchus okinawaensis]